MLKFWRAGGAAALFLLVGAGSAAAETYAARAVEVRHAAARLNVITEDREDIDVSISSGARLPQPQVRLAGGRLSIDGGLRGRIRGCGWGSEHGAVVNGLGRVPLDQLLEITVRMPRQVDLTTEGAVYATVGASAGGRMHFGGCGRSSVGPSDGDLDLALDGSGDVDVGRIGGAGQASVNGSGDLRLAGVAKDASLSVDGSGDADLGAVGGALAASLDGSGNIDVAAAANGAALSLDGSGDINLAGVSQRLAIQLDGSGNITVERMEGGEAALNLDGSGNVTVGGGHADRLVIQLDGSGDIDFKGAAGVLSAATGGSGDITVASADHVENMRSGGSGHIRIAQ